jgi:hypothetical protein
LIRMRDAPRHAEKIVPFIAWGMLGARGVTTAPGGGPLLCTHLYDRRLAVTTFGTAAATVALVVTGIVASSSTVVVMGASAFTAVAVLALVNLVLGPRRVARVTSRSVMPAGDAGADRGRLT